MVYPNVVWVAPGDCNYLLYLLFGNNVWEQTGTYEILWQTVMSQLSIETNHMCVGHTGGNIMVFQRYPWWSLKRYFFAIPLQIVFPYQITFHGKLWRLTDLYKLGIFWTSDKIYTHEIKKMLKIIIYILCSVNIFGMSERIPMTHYYGKTSQNSFGETVCAHVRYM